MNRLNPQGISTPKNSLSQASLDLSSDVVSANPSAAPSQLTYSQLRENFLSFCPTDSAKRTASMAINKWLTFIKKALPDPIGTELEFDFESSLVSFRNKMGMSLLSDKTASNVAALIRSFRTQYLYLLNGSDLPPLLADAIKAALLKKKMTPHSLRAHFPESVYHWAVGNTTPKRNSSLAVMHKLEQFLDLPPDSLVVRAHKVPVKVHDLSKDIPWRRYMSVIRKNLYRLKEEDLPIELSNSINDLVAFKRMSVHMLPNGNIISLKAKDCWNSESTIEIRKDGFLSFFGFLVLPKSPTGTKPLTWEDSLKYGLGLNIKNLRFTMLLDINYLFAYVQYAQLRTYDKTTFEAQLNGTSSGVTPHKTLSTATLGFIVSVNNLINKSHSFLRVNPIYAKEVGVEYSQWNTWLDEKHTAVLGIARHVNNRVEHGKRSNKEVVQELLRMANPMEIIFKMLAQMRAELPPLTAPMWRAAALRDIAMISLLTFDPLRLRNFTTLEIGKHIKEDKNGRFTLEIRDVEYKNYIYGHAEDRMRVLPPQVEADFRAWLAVRSQIVKHNETALLFTAVQKKTAGKGTKFLLSRNTYYEIMSKNSTKYLGLHIGAHAFRTLMATTVAKNGTPQQVKAILNDSEAIAMNIYRDERNADQFTALDDIYKLTAGQK